MSSKQRSFCILLLVEVFIIAVAIAIGVREGNPNACFREGKSITWISVVHLLAISIISFKILSLRRSGRGRGFRNLVKSSGFVWGILALGFFLLACDESFRLHESADKRIHEVFGWTETGLTDRIDDILVGVYGLVGMGILFIYRKEIARYEQAHPFFLCGFLLLFVMVFLDVITNRNDFLEMLMDPGRVPFYKLWLSVGEESLKVLSEGCFLFGFYTAWQTARGTWPEHGSHS